MPVTVERLREIRTECNAEDLPAHQDMCVMSEKQARAYYRSGGVQMNRAAVLFMEQEAAMAAGGGPSNAPPTNRGAVATTSRSYLPCTPQTTQTRKRTTLEPAQGA